MSQPPLAFPAHMRQNMTIDQHYFYQHNPQALIQWPIAAQYQSSALIGRLLVESTPDATYQFGQASSKNLDTENVDEFWAWLSGT